MRTMEIRTVKFKMNTLLLFITMVGSLLGCGKSKVVPPVVTPPATYKNPAQYGTPYANIPATKDIVMYEVNIKTFTPANFRVLKPGWIRSRHWV